MAGPLILVTGPDRGGWPLWFFAALNIRLAGGRPRRVTPSRPWRGGRFDGLLIGGGADIDPRLYASAREPEDMGREVGRAVQQSRGLWRKLLSLLLLPLVWLFRRISGHNVLGGLDGPRDRLEFDLLGRAELDRAPVLGICRGMQLINVYRGGTLHRELSGYYGETPAMRTIRPRKWVDFAGGSRLRKLTGKVRLRVNALHNQAVDELGRDLGIAAVEDAGVVQAIELRTTDDRTSETKSTGAQENRFVLGVQWHPELLPQHRSHRAVFRGLVDAAAAFRSARG